MLIEASTYRAVDCGGAQAAAGAQSDRGLFPPDSAFSGYASHAAKRHSVLEAAPSARQITTTSKTKRGHQHLYRPHRAIAGAARHHSSRRRPCKKQCDECCIWKLATGRPHPEKRPRGQCVPHPPTAQPTSQLNGGPRKLHT
jgi:hypothetical protein